MRAATIPKGMIKNMPRLTLIHKIAEAMEKIAKVTRMIWVSVLSLLMTRQMLPTSGGSMRPPREVMARARFDRL